MPSRAMLNHLCRGLVVLLPWLLGGCLQPSAIDLYLRGQLAADQGNLDGARADLTKAIEKNPHLSLAYMARGEVSKAKGEYQTAADDFEKVTKMEPFNFHAHYQLGLMYQYLKRFADAVGAYQRAVEIRPLDPEANINLAVVYIQMGSPWRGLPYAERAVSGADDSSQTHANLGILYAQLGRNAQAITELKRSIELNSKQPEVYLNLATEYMKQGRFELARNVLATAQILTPTPAISERLGLCYYKLADLPNAVTAYQDALRQQEQYAPALNGLGVVAMTASLRVSPPDVELAHQALAFWQHSLQIDPNQPVIKQLVDKYSAKAK